MITIRSTILTDAPILHDLQTRAFMPLYERYHDPRNPALRGIEDVTRRLETENFRYFTILDDDEIVGGIYYHVHGKGIFFDELKPGEYYLGRIYIAPEYQGRRIARQAIALCEAQFPDAVWFGVDFPQDLDKNRRCYEACGFADTGRRQETDPGVVLAFMEKRVSLAFESK